MKEVRKYSWISKSTGDKRSGGNSYIYIYNIEYDSAGACCNLIPGPHALFIGGFEHFEHLKLCISLVFSFSFQSITVIVL